MHSKYEIKTREAAGRVSRCVWTWPTKLGKNGHKFLADDPWLGGVMWLAHGARSRVELSFLSRPSDPFTDEIKNAATAIAFSGVDCVWAAKHWHRRRRRRRRQR